MALFVAAMTAYVEGRSTLVELLGAVETEAREAGASTDVLLVALGEAADDLGLADDVRQALHTRLVERSLPERDDAAALASAGPNGSRTTGERSPRQADFSPPPPPSADDDRTQIFAPKPGELAVGDVIRDRFELEQELGAGGMGKVFKALDRLKVEAKDREPHVAIKVLTDAFRKQPVSFIALQREAKKAQGLAHPNIVRVYDFDRAGEHIYMTMEYLSGESLDTVLKRPGFTGLPLPKVLEIIEPIGAALGFAHRRGIVHSDFKPSNVFLTDGGEVKVIDFGIARAVNTGAESDGEKTAFDVSTLHALTPAYASPDMIDGLDPDPRDDVFALAVVTYELLTGKHPFGRVSAAIARGRKLEPVAPPGLTRRQWAGLKSGLAFDRDARAPNADAFVASLAATGGSSNRWAWVAGIVVLLALAGGGFGYYWTMQQGETVAVVTPPPEPPATPKPPVPSPPESGPATQDGGGAGTPITPPPEPQPAVVLPNPAQVDSVVRWVPCAILKASVEGGRVVLAGYASSDLDQQALGQTLRTIPGVTDVRTNIVPIPPQKCPSVEVFKAHVETNRDRDLGLKLTTPRPGGFFRKDDALVLNIQGVHYDSYIYVDYFTLDGNVVHLLPSQSDPNNRLPASGRRTLGDSGEWTIAGPFGTDMITVTAAPAPLFPSGARQVEERTETYLRALRAAISHVDAADPTKPVASEILFITTAP